MKYAAELVISAANPAQFLKDSLPQIALCGRSNVGKSSLINTMLQRRNLARTSRTPGKTRQLNFYRIEPATGPSKPFYFVDLPGYGYSKVSHGERESWRRLVETYFESASKLRGSKTLVGAISIIDARLEPMASDLELHEWLHSLEIPTIIVATKTDKLSNNQKTEALRKINATVARYPLVGLVPFSAVTGQGRDELWKLVERMV